MASPLRLETSKRTTLQHKKYACGMKRAVFLSSDSLTPVDLNLTYSHHLIPTVFEVGDSRIQTSHAIPASRI